MAHTTRQQRWRIVNHNAVRGAGALVLITLVGLAAAGRPPAASPSIPTTPPGLAALYPPAADSPVYLMAMHGLQESFAGIVVDLLEDDLPGARSGFAELQERYRLASALVPEWRDAFPEAPLEELGAVLAGGDRASIIRAHDAVGAVCHSCHLAAMVPVQQLYRWGSFDSLAVTDPVAGDSGSYASFKHGLAGAFSGIARDLKQDQVEQARRQFQAFRARFSTLGETCFECHSTPRRAFTDRDVEDLIEDLGDSLDNPSPDLGTVERLSAQIGQASCSGCHLVHVPAAMAQAQRRAAAENRR